MVSPKLIWTVAALRHAVVVDILEVIADIFNHFLAIQESAILLSEVPGIRPLENVHSSVTRGGLIARACHFAEYNAFNSFGTGIISQRPMNILCTEQLSERCAQM